LKKVFSEEILDIWDEAKDIKTFRVKRPADFSYVAGQECLVSLTDGRFPKKKSPMSIGSSPSDTSSFELTIKQYGTFTQTLHQLKVGDTIQVQGPLGKVFRFDQIKQQKIVFLAAGTGLVPFMSILRYAHGNGLTNQFILINSNKARENIIYMEELSQIERSSPYFKMVHTLTHIAPQAWSGMKRRIDAKMIEQMVPTIKDWLFFVCGPAEMVLNSRDLLLNLGVSAGRIKFDPWGIQHEKKIQS